MRSDQPITSLKGIGNASAAKMRKLGIRTVGDLVHHFPRRYEDYSRVVPIKDASPGNVTVQGEITRIHTRKTQRGRHMTTALIDDGTGALQAVWFNQPYLSRSLPRNTPVYVAGELAFAYQQYALQSPTVERMSAFPKNAARIVPVYPETDGISSKQIRSWLQHVLPVDVTDPLPRWVRDSYHLMPKQDALHGMHFPGSMEEAEQARYRLAFEELYLLLLALRSIKQETKHQTTTKLTFDAGAVQSLVDSLPFSLTDSQRKTAWRIIQDMQQDFPMNRLLQGDVGSGKTVVAAIAAAVVVSNRSQAVLLAPTSVLAEQHFATMRDILSPLDIDVALLTGATPSVERKDTLERLRTGAISVCIGTHALLEEDVVFADLGLAIVDEQHRFGVKQRNLLHTKSATTPHLLSMTATPIPRSLALTVYGDLDVSFLRDMPPGRKPVTTYVTGDDSWVYRQLREHIAQGGQIYIVCPLIEDSDTTGAKSVQAEITTLSHYLSQARIGSLHGRMKTREKSEIMRQFHHGEVDILVATTVVEVGMDVPNATAIVIEGAERFGLATLHQLRGRVGRSDAQAYCYIKPSNGTFSSARLQLMEYHNNGRLLAEKDLQLRGAGELHGERQHGVLDMRLARLSDIQLIEAVRTAVAHTPELPPQSRLARAVRRVRKQKHLN